MVLNIVSGGIADVSRRPGFHDLFRADLAVARAACVQPGDVVILAHHDRNADEGLTRCTAPYAAGCCPPGREMRFPDCPATLRDFLRRTGYLGE